MKEAFLIPASSPGWKSASSTSQPLRSQYRVYMRKSICAQSCDSVPPAPERVEAPGELIQFRWERRHALAFSVKPRWRESPKAAGSFRPRKRSAHHSGASEQLPLGRGHPARVDRGLVIVAAAVQDAVR